MILNGSACTLRPANSAPPGIAVTIPSTGYAALDQFRASRVTVFMNDFGQLTRYRPSNATLAQPQPGERRVVFFGDSITENWDINKEFVGKPYVNRGIGGQTTSQMLVRFRQDVIDLQPKVVVILAGTNDIGGTTGPISNEDIEHNFADFGDLARAHNIRVILASILPVNNYSRTAEESFRVRPMSQITALNTWLKDYSAAQGFVYLDYFSALVDERGYLSRDLADDGVHPNAAGYKVMAALASNAIEQVW
jgi:lysophospholipase L1-like esterase